MCNDYRQTADLRAIMGEFSELKIRLVFPQGAPNLEPRDDIRITDRAPIVRAGDDAETAELINMRWSWPGPAGKPVYNFRSDGREFPRGRCLIVADGLYEFTTPEGAKRGAKKHKWLFTLKGAPLFCIAGLWRTSSNLGDAFTMLTAEPGPDVAPYHSRQIVVLGREDWGRWLDPKVRAREVLRPLPTGSLAIEQVG